MLLNFSQTPRRRVAFCALLAFLACLFFGCVSMQLNMVKQATADHSVVMSSHHQEVPVTQMCTPDQQECSWKIQPLDLPQPDVSYVLLFWLSSLAAGLLFLWRTISSLLYLSRPEFAERRAYPLSYPRVHRLHSLDLN